MFGFKRDRSFEKLAQQSFAFIARGTLPTVQDCIYSPESFGNAQVTLVGDRIRVQVTRDRNQILIDLGPVGYGELFDVDVVLQLVGAASDAQRLVEDGLKGVDLPATAIERNLAAILERFEKPRWQETKAALIALKQRRAIELFGDHLGRQDGSSAV